MQEALDGGQLDLLKGSFYANPMQDNDDMEAYLRQQYPSYCRQSTQPCHSACYQISLASEHAQQHTAAPFDA